ncbi:HipA domain-containing protein [Sphingomonas sp.]|uniref:HipA domain-containing protein n=1 Tax=Sphingomonas sp. TaxID=28214 RepID=UPI003B00C46F
MTTAASLLPQSLMPPTRLLESGTGPGFFAVSRFDRLGDRRLHFQPLAGLLDRDSPDGGSYEELLLDHMAITSGAEPDEQLVRRMVLTSSRRCGTSTCAITAS